MKSGSTRKLNTVMKFRLVTLHVLYCSRILIESPEL